MLTKILKWTAISVLIGGLFWPSNEVYSTVLQFSVSAAAIVVFVQCWRLRQYIWMILFMIAACLFNPVLPFTFSNHAFAGMTVFTAALFFSSMHLLERNPLLSMPSITDRMPRSKWL